MRIDLNTYMGRLDKHVNRFDGLDENGIRTWTVLPVATVEPMSNTTPLTAYLPLRCQSMKRLRMSSTSTRPRFARSKSRVASIIDVSSENVPAGCPWTPPDAMPSHVNVSRGGTHRAPQAHRPRRHHKRRRVTLP